MVTGNEFMKSHRSVFKIAFIIACFLLIIFTLSACDPSVYIEVLNQSNATLKLYTGDTFVGEAKPGAKVRFETAAIFPKYEIIAKDMLGNVVYTAKFTREDISGKKNYRVIIPATANGVEPSGNAVGK
jgi:hypothetical protein